MKFRYIFYVLLFSFFFVFLTSNSYANHIGSETLTALNNDINKLYTRNVINESCKNKILQKINGTGTQGETWTKYVIIIGKGNNNNYNGKMDTNDCIYIFLTLESATNIKNYTNNTGNTSYNSWTIDGHNTGNLGLLSCRLSDGTNSTTSSWSFNQLVSPFYVYSPYLPINTRVLTLSAGQEYGGNYLNTDLQYEDLYHEIIQVQNQSFYNPKYSRSVLEWRIGTLINMQYHENIKMKLYILSNSGDVLIQTKNIPNEIGKEEIFLNNNYIYYRQGYKIKFEYDYGEQTNFYYYYFTPFGEDNTSGETIVNTDINNNNDINQNNFIGQLYNDLFVVSSGDVQDIYNLVESYFPSGETPISIYDTIFGSLNNSPSDFIITWDSHPLNFTSNGNSLYSGDFISAGSINISKTVRENDILRLIKFWVNTFVVIGFLLTYYHTLYNCWLHILGVVSEDVSDIVKDSSDYKRNDIGFKM